MAVPQGLCVFTGINQILRADFTLSHGISPSVATLDIVPQERIVTENGTMTFTYEGVVLQFPGCKIDKASFRRDQQGYIIGLAVLDRRWRWTFGEINGHYNIRDERGDLVEAYKKQPHELAKLCLQAMGESNFNISALRDAPVTYFAQVEWEAANPGEELARICEQFGCRVVLQVDNTIAIRTLGTGNNLPIDATVLDQSSEINPPERPDAIKVICGKNVYQAELELEPVGLDSNGDIKHIDLLSYKPTNGWVNEPPGEFSGVSGTTSRAIATQTVWRWYRIADRKADGTYQAVPGFVSPTPTNTPKGFIANRRQLLPLEDDFQVSYGLVEGYPIRQRAIVIGTHFQGTMDVINSSSTEPVRSHSFNIDLLRGIVQFDGYVVKFNADNKWTYADLKLKIGVRVRDEHTLQWTRYSKRQASRGSRFITPDRVVLRDEIILRHDSTGSPINQTKVDTETGHYIRVADLDYQTTFPQDVTYAGIRPLNPDGAIQQVQWSTGLGGATTRASRNMEFSPVVTPYALRRVREQLRLQKLQEIARMIQARRSQQGVKDYEIFPL